MKALRLYTHTHTHTHTNNLRKERGITLVALVVTIVVLLILAGVSINLVVGQNGLITRAKEAKEKMHEETIKEQIDMALTSYEIEKANNGKGDINSEYNGIENFELIEENPSEDVKFIAKVNNKLVIMKSDGSSIVTKENLVKNGFVTNGNENFSDTTEKNGILSMTSNANSKDRKIFSDDYIPIDTSKKYYEGVIAQNSSYYSIDYIGLAEYDVDKNLITDRNVFYVKNSLTTLARDLDNGDTEIYLNDISEFKISDMTDENNGLIFWNYKDSTGYQYPELTYSRNVFYDLFDKDSFDLENNKIKLKNPWSYGKIEKGTKLSQSSKDGNFNYGVWSGEGFNSQYKLNDNYIEGINDTGHNKFSQFRSGTKYVKILFRINFYGLDNVNFNIKDIIFAECE